MTRLTGFSPKVRHLIKERAGVDDTGETVWVRCEGCGVWYSDGWYDLHHRIPRGAGGTKRPHVNGAANGLCLGRHCCHAFAESHRTEALGRGWLISMHRKDVVPSEVPVLLHDGWWILSDSGEKYSVPAPDRGAA